MDKPNIIITGMARSGTSLTASVFAGKGYFVGEPASQADMANPRGYFENKALVDANVELLRTAGFDHHNTWMYEAITDQMQAALNHLKPTRTQRDIVHSYDQRSPWVWKDIRLCFTLPAWLDTLDLNRIRFVIVRRRPEGICHSIRRHNAKKTGSCTLASIHNLMEQHIHAAKTNIANAGGNYVEIHYEDFFAAPEQVAQTLSELIGTPIGPDELNVAPDLNHDTPRDRVRTALSASLDHSWLQPVKRCLKAFLTSSRTASAIENAIPRPPKQADGTASR